jgi:hypothetical protein
MKRAWLIGLITLSAFASEANGERDGVRCPNGGLNAVDATNAIVGEAAGCPYVVKLGIGEALRHRAARLKHPLAGVYGFHAAVTRHSSPAVWREAARAWAASAHTDLTHGAVNFGNAADVRKGTFTGLHLTAILGAGKNATYFFKP